jgi:phenylacetate-CoA oxygenase PaaI subunit
MSNWQGNDQAVAALVNLIVVLADNKYFLGRRISEWTVGAPGLEEAVAASALAQEELGHARVLYPLLDELPFPERPVPLEREGDRKRRYALSLLDRPWQTWPEAVAGVLLVDTALTTMLEHLTASFWEPLARRAARMLQEEVFHLEFAEGRVRELAALPGVREELAYHLEAFLPEVLLWFGPEGEEGVKALAQEGLVQGSNEGWRQAFLGRLAPLFLEEGLRLLPYPSWDMARRRYEYGELPWRQWNRLQRRLESAAVGG